MAAAFVRDQRGIELGRDFGELGLTLEGIGPSQDRVLHLHLQPHTPFIGDRNRHTGKAQIAVGEARFRTHQQQFAFAIGMGGDGEIVEIVAPVIEQQPGHLAFVRRRKAQLGLGGEIEVLLAAGDKRLLEPGGNRLAAVEPQSPRHGGHREDAFGFGCPQPLEIERQLGAIEGIMLFLPVSGLVTRGRQLDLV